MIEKVRESVRLSWEEMVHKVSWPSWPELQSSAVLTLVASIIISLIVFLMDSAFENIFKIVYQFFE